MPTEDPSTRSGDFPSERALFFFRKIRCLRPENETIDRSKTEFAKRLRQEIHEVLESNPQITEKHLFETLISKHGKLVFFDGFENPKVKKFRVYESPPLLLMGTLVMLSGLRRLYRGFGPITSRQALQKLLRERYVSIDVYPFTQKEGRILENLVLVPTKRPRVDQKH